MRYFKKLLSITLYASIVLWITSCKKDITPVKNYDPTVGVVSLIKNDNGFMPGKYVYFQVMQNADDIDTSTSFTINVFGKFANDITGDLVNGGDIIINNSQVISSGPGNLYQYTYDQNTLQQGKSLIGNFIDVQVKGSNSVDSLSRKLYIPRPIFVHSLYKSISTISNNKSYNLTWNRDPQNMFGKVLVEVEYHSGLSIYNNPGNPKSVGELIYTPGDNGSFVIPAADLKRFPVSSYISINISRASDDTWLTDRSHIEYIAVLTANSAPILIQN
ncbi:MAG: hypothetical protein ABI863_09245 [Ginsengibacter sp.]